MRAPSVYPSIFLPLFYLLSTHLSFFQSIYYLSSITCQSPIKLPLCPFSTFPSCFHPPLSSLRVCVHAYTVWCISVYVCEQSSGPMLDYLSFFLFSVIKCLVRSKRSEEGFVLVHIWRIKFIMAENSWQWEPVADSPHLDGLGRGQDVGQGCPSAGPPIQWPTSFHWAHRLKVSLLLQTARPTGN